MKVPAGSQHLSTCMDEGDHLRPQIPENSQVPLRKLTNKVIFICISVSGALAGTCWHYLSQMEVAVSGHVTPAGVICKCISSPLCYALVSI